jgi:hypothetical protein
VLGVRRFRDFSSRNYSVVTDGLRSCKLYIPQVLAPLLVLSGVGEGGGGRVRE